MNYTAKERIRIERQKKFENLHSYFFLWFYNVCNCKVKSLCFSLNYQTQNIKLL